MYCPKCGAKLKEGAKFCNKCGAKVGETQTKPEKIQPQDPKKPVAASNTVSNTATAAKTTAAKTTAAKTTATKTTTAKTTATDTTATMEAAAANVSPPKKKSPALLIFLLILLLFIVLGAGSGILYHLKKSNEAVSLKPVQTELKEDESKEDESESRKNRKKEEEEEEKKAAETTKAFEESDSSSSTAAAETTKPFTMPETTAIQKTEPISAIVQYADQTSFDGLLKAGVLMDTAYDSSHVVQNDTTIDNSGWSAFDGQIVTSWQEGVDGDGIGEYIGISFDSEYQVQVLTLHLGNHRSDSWYIKNNTPETLTVNLSGQVFQVDFPKEKTEFAVVLSNPVAASDIRITIDSVYSGTEYTDTTIAEVGVYGY